MFLVAFGENCESLFDQKVEGGSVVARWLLSKRVVATQRLKEAFEFTPQF